MDEIVAFDETERFIDLPVRTYSSVMYMRLGFSVASHIQADVLLLDEVFAVGDEDFQRKCFGKIADFKRRGGTIVFVSHDAQAVERLCDRAVLLRQGEVMFDGTTREAIARYRRLLAEERAPDELAAGRVLDADGDERRQFAAGEPMTVELEVAAHPELAPPVVSLELRDDDGAVLAGLSQPTAALGWTAAGGRRVLRFELDRLPLADGRFHLRVALADAEGGRLLHSLADVLSFFVFPDPGETGAVRLAGLSSLHEAPTAEPVVQPLARGPAPTGRG